jgi:hypothetical protein
MHTIYSAQYLLFRKMNSYSDTGASCHMRNSRYSILIWKIPMRVLISLISKERLMEIEKGHLM